MKFGVVSKELNIRYVCRWFLGFHAAIFQVATALDFGGELGPCRRQEDSRLGFRNVFKLFATGDVFRSG